MSSAVAAGVVVAGAAVYGAVSAKQASDKAAKRQREAASQNVEFLQEQGALGAEAIRVSAEEATAVAEGIPGKAIAPLQPFADIGRGAYDLGKAQVMGGGGSPAMRAAVARAAKQAVTGSPISPESAAVQGALGRQSRLTGQRTDPSSRQQLLGLGLNAGVGGARDIAGIQQRGRERVGDIAASSTAQRAGVMLGQVPEMAGAMQTGQDARLLGSVGTNAAIAGFGENLGKLAGRYFPERTQNQNPYGLPQGPQSRI